jgi:ankyrin repeat protein
MLRLLLDRRPDDVSTTDDVLRAAAGNFYEGSGMLNLLLDRHQGDTVKVTDGILRSAAASGCETNLRLLEQRCSADINESLLSTCELFHSVRTGDDKNLSGLLATESNPDIRDYCHRSPLWWAVASGHVEVVQLLLNRHVDVNVQSSITGLTPIILAAINEDSYMVESLLNAGADHDLPAYDGRTALSVVEAGYERDEDIIEMLKKHNSLRQM